MQVKSFSTILIFVLLVFTVGAVGAESGLRVGAARVDVTGAFGPSQTGKYDHERVYVRAIVLDSGAARAALISVKSGQFDYPATLKGVGAELNCPVENVIISGTHTHSGSADRRSLPGKALPPEAQVPSQPILDAVRQAKAKLQPATQYFNRK